MSAIERILKYMPTESHEHHCAYFFPIGSDDEDECNCGLEQRRADAADLGSLYQAAKVIGAYHAARDDAVYAMVRWDEIADLFEAVRRVEGE